MVKVQLHSTGDASRGPQRGCRAGGPVPSGCVAPRSNIPDILARRALPDGRLAGLGATLDFHHGLLGSHYLLPSSRRFGVAKKVSHVTAESSGNPNGFVRSRLDQAALDQRKPTRRHARFPAHIELGEVPFQPCSPHSTRRHTPLLHAASRTSIDRVGRNLKKHRPQLNWVLAADTFGAYRGPLSTAGIESIRADDGPC